MKLSEKDVVFVRKGFGLHNLIKVGHTKKNIPVIIRAKVIYFEDGFTIQKNMTFF